ncbi:mitochondrial carrier [Galdieria sulphuraria]|uniref:Mitochondrial carrier n=1 Tax=Galdieria sulphuraria TaxID=130081 RepID=M2WX85_GALSU|nr:mitochondrial carrier [Galdieria sulphuraria]EME28640.1 mitochondrial carrier [Galdieria sulphuraria]|eukprot:XP_005705160.1 mitochondrial carrier [Galdieria sulphuraria]
MKSRHRIVVCHFSNTFRICGSLCFLYSKLEKNLSVEKFSTPHYSITNSIEEVNVLESNRINFYVGTSSLKKPKRNDKLMSRLCKIFVAGFVSGALTSIVITPVEVVTALKSRVNSPYSSLSLPSILLRVWKEQGWKGLFDGWTGFVLKSAVTKSLRLALFEQTKYFLQTKMHPSRDITPKERLLAVSLTGMMAMAICYPLHATQTLKMKGLDPPKNVRVVYGGWFPAVLRMVPQYGLEYLFYDILRTEVSRRKRRKHSNTFYVDLNLWSLLVLSAVSSLFAQTIAQPFNVISKRMTVLSATDSEKWRKYSQIAAMFSVASEVWRESGIFGFFRGLRYRYLKAIPSVFMSKVAMLCLNSRLGLSPSTETFRAASTFSWKSSNFSSSSILGDSFQYVDSFTLYS